MPLILPGNVASATAPTTFSVANSCRFNDGDTPDISRTIGTATDVDKWTYSVWLKRGVLTGAKMLIFSGYSDGSNFGEMIFKSDDTLDWLEYPGGVTGRLTTNRLFRDVSAWYHLVFVYDSGNATAGNRMRLYVNGTEETSFATDTNPAEDANSMINTAVLHKVGNSYGTDHFDGYMAECVFCDGQAYAASDFGEFNEDSPTIWQPKDVSGLTFGTNGFYLDFEASDNLGNDANGGTDWSESNIAAADQSLDSPTNNFCTLNSIAMYPSAGTFSQGNNTWANATGNYRPHIGTIGLSSGLWYFETKQTLYAAGQEELLGIIGDAATLGTTTSDGGEFGYTAYQYAYNATSGNIRNNNGLTSYGIASAQNSILGVYIDLNANKLYIAKDGTVMNSGTGHSIAAASTQPDGVYYPGIAGWSGQQHLINFNFGNGCFGDTAVSSGNTDANGYGNFEYDPSAGTFDSASKDFLAICTKNLATDG